MSMDDHLAPIRIEAELKKAVDEASKRTGLSVAEIQRRSMLAYLAGGDALDILPKPGRNNWATDAFLELARG